MLPSSKSMPGLGAENIFGGAKPKKKAPPRPPLPSHAKLQSSQSLKTPGAELGFMSSTSRSDLIDFASPGDVNVLGTLQTNQPKEFMYRVGASIFYIRSPLKSSSLENTAHKMPFSPPRPSADALLMASPIKTNTPKANVAPPLQPTIIRTNHAGSGSNPAFHSINNNPVPAAPVNYNNNNTWQSTQSQSQNKYGNVPGGWDEPPKKVASLPPPIAPKPVIAAKPTIIRPSAAQAPSLASVLTSSLTPAKPVAVAPQPTMNNEPRNYYDEPPADFEDVPEVDSSPPMPDEPPPPPPPVDDEDWDDEWDEASNGTSVANSDERNPDYQTGADQPYAIALYDYVPEQEGDLALNAGDLVYLINTVDDCWLYGAVDGAEGMFPSNHVNIVVPLPSSTETGDQNAYVPEYDGGSYEATTVEPQPVETQPVETQAQAVDNKTYHANVLYTFNAEAEGDLSLEAGDIVTLWGKINDDWLYGSANRKQGQFPANFVSPVPDDLPVLNF